MEVQLPAGRNSITKMTARYALYMSALKIFENLTMPTATFPLIFNGLFFRWMLWVWICVQNLFLALPVPEIIGVAPKWAVPGYAPTLPFLQWAFFLFGLTVSMFQPNLKFIATHSWEGWDRPNWGCPKILGSPWIRKSPERHEETDCRQSTYCQSLRYAHTAWHSAVKSQTLRRFKSDRDGLSTRMCMT